MLKQNTIDSESFTDKTNFAWIRLEERVMSPTLDIHNQLRFVHIMLNSCT